MKAARYTTQRLALIISALLAVCVGGWLALQYWNSKAVDATNPSQIDPLLPTSPVTRPLAPPEGYVGSAECANCHGDLCKSFAQHPMGRSSALALGSTDLENYSQGKAVFTTADGTRYKAEKVGNKVLHHEIGTDVNGRTIYELSVPVELAIGSGTRGKTYGVNRDGILLQSPISWYSGKGGYFELSPGYEKGVANPHFGRRLTEECLVCHVGKMEFDPDVPDKLNPPYYHEIAISCENCHGPGEKHVHAQQAGKISSPDSTIVNPARLPIHLQESICNQCHLHGVFRSVRYGRHYRDFRPGLALEEIFCILVKKESSNGVSKSVSQVEQMRESACFQGNPEKLGCISCHDPHEWPEPQKQAEYYRNRCNECHADRGCSLPASSRAEKSNSCIACHMPNTTPTDVVHASQTDHRVLKNPSASPSPESLSDAAPLLGDLKVYGDGEKRLPYWEVQRAKGLMLAMNKKNSDSQEALSLLLPLTKVAPDDIPLLRAIGTIYLDRKDYSLAKKWLEQAVAVEPKNEYVQLPLALACWGAKDHSSAKQRIAQAIKINPFSADYFAIQAKICASAGDYEEALQAADKAVELDPSKIDFREELLKSSGP